jgi:hypothetical protein
VTGIPAEEFPDSSFWNKTPDPYVGEPSTLGSPRLVVAFQTPSGQYDGYADLREVSRLNDWERVSDETDYPNSAWDVMNKPTPPCSPFAYSLTWYQVQACFAGDTTLAVYLTTDAYGIYHLIDDIMVNGKTFSSASDNGGREQRSRRANANRGPESAAAPLSLAAALTDGRGQRPRRGPSSGLSSSSPTLAVAD